MADRGDDSPTWWTGALAAFAAEGRYPGARDDFEMEVAHRRAVRDWPDAATDCDVEGRDGDDLAPSAPAPATGDAGPPLPQPGPGSSMWCRRCESAGYTVPYQSQMRSADEAMTTFVTCTRCGTVCRLDADGAV